LVDWPGYRLFGLGRSAGIQFSRGCPLTCTYCGQWLFWKKWRHRSPHNFVAELTKLAQLYGVKIVWLADENFAAKREVVREVLERLVEADLDLSLNINMTAADVVRDADLLPLYKTAGVDYVVMGVESLEDEVVRRVRKNNPFHLSKEAIRLLRQHEIVSLANIIYGLEDETLATLRTKFKKICELDPDILNAVYLTPHFWTAAGRALDQSHWTYRNQVIATPHLSPGQLFWGVKATEALFHLRPRAVARLWGPGKERMRQILRSSLAVGAWVILAEIRVGATSFSPRGSLVILPGAVPHFQNSQVRNDYRYTSNQTKGGIEIGT
jgi:anaerobic magnesium-protoporphyrin IX monomethyl ester cyclase